MLPEAFLRFLAELVEVPAVLAGFVELLAHEVVFLAGSLRLAGLIVGHGEDQIGLAVLLMEQPAARKSVSTAPAPSPARKRASPKARAASAEFGAEPIGPLREFHGLGRVADRLMRAHGVKPGRAGDGVGLRFVGEPIGARGCLCVQDLRAGVVAPVRADIRHEDQRPQRS